MSPGEKDRKMTENIRKNHKRKSTKNVSHIGIRRKNQNRRR
jgi:hypothetical protein